MPRQEEALELEVVEAGRSRSTDFGIRVGQVKNGSEHQHRPGHREQKELERSSNAVRASPDADHHEHRHQHQLPEDVENKQVEGHKRADHPCLEQEEDEAPGLGTRLNRSKRRNRRDRSHERRQQHEPNRNAVYRHVVVNAVAGNPYDVLVAMERATHVDSKKQHRRRESR